MTDGVEAGGTTTEWKAFLSGVLAPLLLPVANGFLHKFFGPEVALSGDQLVMTLTMITTLVGGYVGMRTWRKNTAAKAGLQNGTAASDAIKAELTAASAIADPAARAAALAAVAAKI